MFAKYNAHYYVICNNNDCVVSVTDSERDARTAAENLVSENPFQAFTVVKTVAECRINKVMWIEHE